MEERKLTCIGCPMGCPLTVVMNGKEVVDESDENRNFDRAGVRRKHRYGIGEDERRYPEGQDL